LRGHDPCCSDWLDQEGFAGRILTQAEAGEMLSHLAFYVGWPNVFSAIPVAKTVFEGRPVQPPAVQPLRPLRP
jgi:hypothetical protein